MSDGGAGSVLEARSLRKSYGGKAAVRDVSLSVRQGEIVGLLGPNGAGKTTTFEMIVGFRRPDAGAVLLDGRDISGLPVWMRARRGVSYLPQEISLFQRLTVEENIEIVMESFVRDREERRAARAALLEKMGLGRLAGSVAGTLSGGEKRRLEIARSLINRPRFFLLDEPFSGIDPKTVAEIRETVVALKSEGIGVLITDHNVRDALVVTDRACLIHDGTVLVEGTPAEILAHPDSRRVYFGEGFSL